MNNTPNPYVGPRSFVAGDPFFGRSREIRQLKALLIAERLVLIHSPSGAGKTSLIQAGLLPEMEDENFYVLPVIRVNAEPAGAFADKKVNRYLLSALLSLEEKVPKELRLPDEQLAAISLDEYLKCRARPEGAPNSELLVFDQFEESLTTAPNDREGKLEFFNQLGLALNRPNRWALFAIREDFLGALEPYLRFLPNRLSCHFRLDLLGEEAARQAMRKPAERAGVDFNEGAATQLFDDLSSIQVQLPDGTLVKQTGLYVEPVQLQVVCYNLWQSLEEGDQSINIDDLTRVGDVDQSLAEYYRQSVMKAVAKSDATERQVRDWFENKLIRTGDIRGQVPMGPVKSDGLSNRAIAELINAHVVRSEKRGPITWYELSHDRLIGPVHESNADWYSSHLKPFQLKAAKWAQAGHPTEMLLRGTELAQAQHDASEVEAILVEEEKAFLQASASAWSKENLKLFQRQAEVWVASGRPESLLMRGVELEQAEKDSRSMSLAQDESDYLEASRKAQAQARREMRRNLLITRLAIAASIALVLALAAVGWALYNANQYASLAQNYATISNVSSTSEAVAIRNAMVAQTAVANSDIEKQNALAAQDRAEVAQAQADQEAQVALARQLAARSQLFPLTNEEDVSRSGLLAVEAARRYAGFEANQALQRYINSRQATTISPVIQLNSPVNTVAFSPDGRMVLTGSEDGRAVLWEAATRQPVLALENGNPVSVVAFSPNGQIILTGDRNGIIRVWDIATGKAIRQEQGSGGVTSLAFSPDGQKVISANENGQAELWEVWSGTEIVKIDHSGIITTVAFSPDGQWAATASEDWTVKVIDVQNAFIAAVLTDNRPVTTLAFSPDSRWLLTGNQNGTARLWFAGTEKEYAFVTHGSPVTAIAVSPDSNWAIIGRDDGTIWMWHLEDFQEPFTVQHNDSVTSLAFSPNGQYFVSGSQDGTARVWDRVTGQEIAQMQHDGAVTSITISPDGLSIVSGSEDGTARVWNAMAGAEEEGMQHAGQVSVVAFSPDGSQAVSASYDETIKIWDVATRKIVDSLRHDSYVSSAAFSPDGTLVAAGSGLGTVKVWEVDSGNEVAHLQHEYPVTWITFSPNGTRIASGSYDETVRVWETATGQELAVLKHTSYVSSVAFSPDGQYLASGSGEGTAWVWDAASATVITQLPHQGSVNRVVFSPDGRLVATASEDNTVTIWDWQAPGEDNIMRMKHDGPVLTLAFSADGLRVVSGSLDGTARVWDLATRQESARMQHGYPVYTVTISPDSAQVLSGSENGVARVWDIASGEASAQIEFPRAVISSAISPDGRLALTGNENGSVLIWYIGIDDLINAACSQLTRNLTQEEWQQYISNEPYQLTCPNLPE